MESTSRTRHWVKRRLPFVAGAVHFFLRLPWRYRSIEQRFARTARQHSRSGLESQSGPGSSLAATAAIREELPLLVRELSLRSILDIPCGDFHWMKETDLTPARYIGADIQADRVKSNEAAYADSRRVFVKLDVTRDPLPGVDLILCRDCLVHFSYADIWSALANVRRSDSTYLLTTTFPAWRENRDIVTGEWRPLNFQLPPFRFPEPLRIVNESCDVPRYADKSLGLWRTSDLPLPAG